MEMANRVVGQSRFETGRREGERSWLVRGSRARFAARGSRLAFPTSIRERRRPGSGSLNLVRRSGTDAEGSISSSVGDCTDGGRPHQDQDSIRFDAAGQRSLKDSIRTESGDPRVGRTMCSASSWARSHGRQRQGRQGHAREFASGIEYSVLSAQGARA